MAEHHGFDSVFRVSGQHYAELLARECQVLYLTPPSCIFEPLFLRGKERRFGKEQKETQSIRPIRNLNVTVTQTLLPAVIPLSPGYLISGHGKSCRPRWLIYNRLKYTYPKLGKLLKENGYDNVDVLLLGACQFRPLLDMVKAKQKVYRMIDDISGFQKITSSDLSMEEEICHQVDKVIVTSKNLKKRAKSLGAKEIYYLPNGVDFDHFNSADMGSKPEELKFIPSPRIVYIGAIDNWLDTDLIGYCAQKLPDYSFILIGAPRVDLSPLSIYKNIYILGAKDYYSIPNYLKNCDVGIIPFKKNKLTESVSPIKLYEYMASGLPVVSIETAELRNANSPAFLAKDKYEFVQMINSALELDEKAKAVFVEFARQNSWEDRFCQLKDILGIC
jgi:glycosyltransferase involved in cell wall biosynthesis